MDSWADVVNLACTSKYFGDVLKVHKSQIELDWLLNGVAEENLVRLQVLTKLSDPTSIEASCFANGLSFDSSDHHVNVCIQAPLTKDQLQRILDDDIAPSSSASHSFAAVDDATLSQLLKTLTPINRFMNLCFVNGILPALDRTESYPDTKVWSLEKLRSPLISTRPSTALDYIEFNRMLRGFLRLEIINKLLYHPGNQPSPGKPFALDAICNTLFVRIPIWELSEIKNARFFCMEVGRLLLDEWMVARREIELLVSSSAP